MGSLGFGLERIGIAVLAAPRLATLVLLVSLAAAAAAIPNLQFYGFVVDIVDQSGDAYADYQRQTTEFRDSGKDVAVILRGDDLMTATKLEEVRELHLELELADGVLQVFSMFSLGAFSGDDGAFEPYLPDSFTDDTETAEAVTRLLEDSPSARSLIAPEKNAAMLIVSLDGSNDISETDLQALLAGVRSAIDDNLPQGLEVMLAGGPSIRASMVEAIISDQTTLTMTGIALGSVVSFLIFGTLRSAVICTLPGAMAVLWLLAIFSVSGTKLNYVTTVLPTLGLIIAFADGVVLYFRWQTLNAENPDQLANLRRAILRVGPASALTSITTALAFASFSYASSNTMNSFAWFGVGAVGAAFLGVIAGLPLACYWSVRLGGKPSARRSPLARLGEVIASPARSRPMVPVGLSLILLCLLTAGHLMLQPSYNLSDELPIGSKIRAAERFMTGTFGGASQIFVLIPVAPGSEFSDAPNRTRLIAIDRTLSEMMGAGRVVSLAGIWEQTKPERIEAIAASISDLEPSAHGRFLSADRRSMQVAITVESGQDTDVDAATVEAMRQELKKVGPVDDLTFTGLRVLMAKEFPNLINQLRTGLLIAVFLAVGVVVVATRSFRLGLAALVPNLIPILSAEAIILVSGSRLDITNVIALTIAFGIAIDNGIHIINSYVAERRNGRNEFDAISEGVREIGPALVASTAILCIATVITQFSTLPSVTVLGRLLVVTLIMALGTNLVILPGFIRFLSGEKNENKA